MSQQTETKTISHDGLNRTYTIHTPSGYEVSDMPFPLLFCFHGFTSNANNIMAYSRFNQIAEANDFIVVYPQGSLFSGLTHWNVGGFTEGSDVDDVGFINTLLDTLKSEYYLDTERIYSTGMSNGGYMSFLLACQMSERIAAIASVTGSMTPLTYDECNPQRPVPVMQIHGDADAVVPFEGANFSKSIQEVLDYWIDHNECNTEGEVTDLPDTNTADGSTVSNTFHDNGLECTAVNHFTVHGGDHDWPGAWGNRDINASQEVWDFVSQYNLGGLIGCLIDTEDIAEAQTLNIYPNPTQDFIELEGSDAKVYSIFDKQGIRVKQGEARVKLDVTTLNSGLYFLEIDGAVEKFVKAGH